MIGALPIGFYTSAWNNSPSVVTVDNIKVWLPQYSGSSSTTPGKQMKDKYYRTTYKEEIVQNTIDYSTLNTRSMKIPVTILGFIDTEINLDISSDMMGMLGQNVTSKLTFSGMPNQGYYDDSGNDHKVIVMNEAYSYKNINEGNLDSFIKMLGKNASYKGLTDILSIKQSELPQVYSSSDTLKTTTTYSSIIDRIGSSKTVVVPTVGQEFKWPDNLKTNYPELVKTVDSIYAVLSSKNMDFTVAKLDLAGPTGLIRNKLSLIYFIRDMKFSVTLTTKEEGPCMVFWGLDAMGPEHHVL